MSRVLSRTPAMVALCLLLPFLLPAVARGGEKHPHGGKVNPFQPGDPGVKLGPDAVRILRSGQPWRTQVQSGSTGGRGMVVQDVEAPPDVVWERILDFAAYPKMVPKTVESEVYRREVLKRGIQKVWVRMKIGFPVLKLQFFVEHWYDPSLHSLTWTLDYEKKSDLDDSVGFWYVVPHPDRPTHASRVYYSVEVSMFSWVPAFVVDFMSRQALVDATAWVKKHSELEAARRGSLPSVPPSSTVTESTARKIRWWGWGNAGGGGGSSPLTVDGPGDSVARQGGGSAPVRISEGSGPAVVQEREVGLRRYVLVTTVLALLLYNVHLYFSQ